MVTTSEIAPAPALAPFVRCYSYREFETNGLKFSKPWYASHDQNFVFFFKALPVKLVNASTGEIITRGKSCGIVGTSTQYNGDMGTLPPLAPMCIRYLASSKEALALTSK